MKASVFTIVLFSLFTIATSGYAQLAAKITESKFRRFDLNQSGWLSGNELAACDCRQYDTDGDNEVTLQEFFTGKGVKFQATTSTTKTSTNPSGTTKAKAPLNQAQEKKSGGAVPNITGAWWFTSNLEGNGKVYKLRSLQSGLDLKENGEYVLNTWLGGANNMRTVGTYTINGNRLRMKPSSGDVQNYSLSFSADGTMTMEAPDGRGYTAIRSKK